MKLLHFIKSSKSARNLYVVQSEMISVNDMQHCALSAINSSETESYLSNTVFSSEEEESAFKAGIAYASIKFATSCFRFHNAVLSKDEFYRYRNEVGIKESRGAD